MKYQILLYYKYVVLNDPKKVCEEQRAMCEELGLKGRIVVAHNGINGTVEGLTKQTETYIEEMQKDDRFKDIVFKKSEGTGEALPRLSVKVRQDLVSDQTSEWGIDPRKMTGKYLTSEELHNWIQEKKEFVIMDMRNDYEFKSGRFENSLHPGIENFRDLPKVIPQLKKFADKPIVTVCTGGIRCERASGLLLKYGFKDVYQLKDGIVSYMEKYPNSDFKGKLYVFDNRILMGFKTSDSQHEVIGRCESCGKESEEYINCKNDNCHRHLIVCSNCRNEDGTVTCPQGCRNLDKTIVL